MKKKLRTHAPRRRLDKERERLLAREKTARAEAESASRSKDDFLATISHELRTPLTAMLGWILLLRDGTVKPSGRARALAIIERNMRAQAQIIEDMLDVSRIVTGKLRLDPRPMELAPIVRLALDDIRPEADTHFIRVESDIDEDKEIRVWGDPSRLQQILWNLLSNALKFTRAQGSIRVSLKRAGSFAKITVADTGKGISPEFLPYVFDRFRQEESLLTRSHRGLGLGLAIVHHLTELHGGTVVAASEGLDRGATFTVTLPLTKAPLQGKAEAGA